MLKDLTTALADAIDPLKRQAEIDDALAPFGPDGPWKYAPAEERARVVRQVEDGRAQRAGEALFALEHTARALEVELEAVEQQAMEAPDPEAAHRQRAKVGGVSTTESTLLQVLDELRISRHTRELVDAKPSHLRAIYQAALKDPDFQQNATLIRFLEDLHGAGWRGPEIGNDLMEVTAMHGFLQDIKAARLARIPEDLKARRAEIQAAYALVEQAKGAHRVRSQRPRDWGRVA